ncbi:MAG TPA: SRPBCC family protein [Solirubrobacteraceae bacterium]|nr:SRPBCC family protein [Solirubrobacteraceae bacterium]
MASSQRAVVTLPTDTQIQITREFDAPARLVYRAWTEPDLVRRWWTAKRGEMTVAEIDLRVGGRWRYAMLAHGEFEVAFHGEYLEIVPGERLVSTEIYEGMPDAAATTTTTFAERDGRTTVTILVDHTTQAHRDAHVQSGMEDGLQDALDLLEQLVSSL